MLTPEEKFIENMKHNLRNYLSTCPAKARYAALIDARRASMTLIDADYKDGSTAEGRLLKHRLLNEVFDDPEFNINSTFK